MIESQFLHHLELSGGSIYQACVSMGYGHSAAKNYINRNPAFKEKVKAVQGELIDAVVTNKVSIDKVRDVVGRTPKSRKQIARECFINEEDAATCLLKLRVDREIINRNGKYIKVER